VTDLAALGRLSGVAKSFLANL